MYEINLIKTVLVVKEPRITLRHVFINHFAASLLVRVHDHNDRYPVRSRRLALEHDPLRVQGLACKSVVTRKEMNLSSFKKCV